MLEEQHLSSTHMVSYTNVAFLMPEQGRWHEDRMKQVVEVHFAWEASHFFVRVCIHIKLCRIFLLLIQDADSQIGHADLLQ